MSRTTIRWVALLQIGLILFSTGCHPTQPFFVQRDASMANYLEHAMAIEYADVQVESLPESTQALVPFGPTNIPTEFQDLSLEDCISIALQNTKMLRTVGGSNLQSGSIAAALLSASPGQMPSVFDPAIVSTTGNTQPLVIDSQGNRVASRGSIRANQVGGVEDALSEFDTQFSTIFGYNTTDRPRNVGRGNVFNPQFFQAVDANAQAALSKKMATGTITTARFTTVYSRNNVPASGNALGSNNFGRAVPSDYTAAIELQVTQPLMRGRGTLVNRIPTVLARINEDIALHEFEANVRNLVKSVEDAYWDLYCGYRAFETAKIARESALDLWRVAEARSKISDTAPEAEAQAHALYAQFDAQLHNALWGSPVPGNDPQGLIGREQVLREKLGLSPTDGLLIRPSEDPTTARIQFDWCDVLSEGLVRNTELRRQKWAIKQRELELVSAKNQILPQLDLSATYRFLGVGDQFASANRNGISFPNPGSTALEELTGGEYQELGARIEFTPQAIGKRRALGNIQSAQFQIKKSQEELREKELMLVHELSTAWRRLDSTFTSMKDYLEQLQANEKEIKIYNDKIAGDVGELSQLLDNLLRAEERKARAQLSYYQAICEYNKSIVNIHYLKGSLLDLNSIELSEGAWVEKAYWDAEERSRERAGGMYFDYGYTRPGVVSNGPVESGGLTEGNISDQGFHFGTPSMPAAEEVQAEPESSDRPEQKLPEIKPPTAQNMRGGNSILRTSAVASSSSNQSVTNGFQWGELGMQADSVQPAISSSSNSSTGSRTRISDAPRSDTQWRSRN